MKPKSIIRRFTNQDGRLEVRLNLDALGTIESVTGHWMSWDGWMYYNTACLTDTTFSTIMEDQIDILAIRVWGMETEPAKKLIRDAVVDLLGKLRVHG